MMKEMFYGLVITACAFAQVPKTATYSASDNLVALERMWNQAQLTRDAKAIANMIGDRFVNTEYDGEVSNREKFLADFADPQFKPILMNIQDVRVEMYPNTAVVTGIYYTKGVYGGKAYEHVGRFTDTWILDGGKWMCIASDTSLLKK
jgi:ketosteroid isomerase-like protein